MIERLATALGAAPDRFYLYRQLVVCTHPDLIDAAYQTLQQGER